MLGHWTKRLIPAAVALLSFASCSNIENEQEPANQFLVSITDDAGQSSVSLNNDKFSWSTDYDFSIFRSTTGECFSYVPGSEQNSGELVPLSSNSVKASFKHIYAIYPYSASTACNSENEYSYTLPSVEYYREDGIPSGTLMTSVSENLNSDHLYFQPAEGFLKLQFYASPSLTVKSVTITGNADETLSGECHIKLSEGRNPELAFDEKASGKSITLDFGDGIKVGGSSADPTTAYIALPPVTFNRGLTITVTDTEDNQYVRTVANAVIVERNVIKSFTAFRTGTERIIIGLAQSTTPRLPYLYASVKAAGAVMYEIPDYLTTSSKANEALKDVDAIIIPGSGTSDPSERNSADIMTIRTARSIGMPILGICHGEQYLNKALGGEIVRISTYYPDALVHSGHVTEYYHLVSVDSTSFLYKVNGGKLVMMTNSSHSYCIRPDAVASGLRVVSYSTADNVIEAVESEDGKALGVQWHPEVMYGELHDQTSLEIFKYLVNMATEYHIKKSGN